jgi:hypothetical protein
MGFLSCLSYVREKTQLYTTLKPVQPSFFWRRYCSNYTYYLHALDKNGDIVAQMDTQPLGGKFPTIFWQKGVHFTDDLYLDISDNAEVEQYRFGVYDENIQRGIWYINGEDIGDGLVLIPSGDR